MAANVYDVKVGPLAVLGRAVARTGDTPDPHRGPTLEARGDAGPRPRVQGRASCAPLCRRVRERRGCRPGAVARFHGHLSAGRLTTDSRVGLAATRVTCESVSIPASCGTSVCETSEDRGHEMWVRAQAISGNASNGMGIRNKNARQRSSRRSGHVCRERPDPGDDTPQGGRRPGSRRPPSHRLD